jgi:hypothetical protein
MRGLIDSTEVCLSFKIGVARKKSLKPRYNYNRLLGAKHSIAPKCTSCSLLQQENLDGFRRLFTQLLRAASFNDDSGLGRVIMRRDATTILSYILRYL